MPVISLTYINHNNSDEERIMYLTPLIRAFTPLGRDGGVTVSIVAFQAMDQVSISGHRTCFLFTLYSSK